jgi:hypothetical protein
LTSGEHGGGLERRTRGLVFGGALVLYASMSVMQAALAEIPLSSLAVFFDGHLYMEIAKSFPVPYAEAGRDYAGHAPGYPALIALTRLLVPDALGSWGIVALLAVWLAAAATTVVFYDVCRLLDCPALAGTALFAVANPRWLSLASTAHAEPVSMLLVLLALRAYLRGRLWPSVALLSLSTLARFPALLLSAAFAWGALFARRRWDVAIVAVALPAAALDLFNVYLLSQIPDVGNFAEAHSVLWKPNLIPPFLGLVAWARQPWHTFLFVITYGTVLLYLIAIVVGARPREREHWMLAIWVTAILLFHVSLSNSVPHLPRLVILAWPAALLILWRAVGTRIPNLVVAASCVLLLATNAWVAQRMTIGAVRMQENKWYMPREIELLEVDEPEWVDFDKRVRHAVHGDPAPD